MSKLKYNADDTLKPFIHATDEIEKLKKQVEELRDKLAYSDAWVNEAKNHYEPIIKELREALDQLSQLNIEGFSYSEIAKEIRQRFNLDKRG